MKKTKHDYEKAFQSLVNQLNPVVQKIEDAKSAKITKESLQTENRLLCKALAIYQNHINILNVLINMPIGSGAKANPENEAILLKALEELIIKNKKYPTEKQWKNWISDPKYKPHNQAPRTEDTINGWGWDKAKKFLINNKKELTRKHNYNKISDMFVTKK